MDQWGWVVTNFVAAFLLPPGVFCVLLAVGIWLSGRRRWARWLSVASLALFGLFSLKAFALVLLKPAEDRWPPLSGASVQFATSSKAAIVILGGGRTLGALEYPEGETLSRASARRTIYAARLAATTKLPLVVSGGAPGGGRLSEAALIRDLLESGFGLQVAFSEGKSLNTLQSAENVAEILAKPGIKTVVLVTDVTHMTRAARAYEAVGLHVIAAPVNFQASGPLNVTDFLPSVEGLELCRQVIREQIGELWYRLRRVAGV